MIDFRDYKDADGNIDFQRYYSDGIATGDLCSECRKPMYYPETQTGKPQTCSQCKQLAKDTANPVEHASKTRCPYCQSTEIQPYKHAPKYGAMFVKCGTCRLRYRVELRVQYWFVSPAVEASAHSPAEIVGQDAAEDSNRKLEGAV